MNLCKGCRFIKPAGDWFYCGAVRVCPRGLWKEIEMKPSTVTDLSKTFKLAAHKPYVSNAAAIREAVLAERDRCAKVCEAVSSALMRQGDDDKAETADDCAEEIRKEPTP